MRSNTDIIKNIVAVFVIYMASAMIISPTSAINGAENALRLCADKVIPSLFPFIFCSNMFISLGIARIASRTLSPLTQRLFGISGAGSLAIVLGVTSGYPIGAVCAASLYQSGECTKTEASRLLAFCNNSGPMFVIGSIGIGMLQNYRIGVFLYLIHLFSALICGIIFKGWGNSENKNTLPPAFEDAEIKNAVPDMGTAIEKSVDTMLIICGFIIIFSVFTSVIPDCSAKKYIYSFLEVTGGLNLLFENPNTLTLPLASFFLALSGLSVFAQVCSVVMPCGLSPKPYLAGKLLQGMVAFFLTFAATRLSPRYIPVYMQKTPPRWIFTPREAFGFGLTGIAVSLVLLIIIIFIVKIWERYIK